MPQLQSEGWGWFWIHEYIKLSFPSLRHLRSADAPTQTPNPAASSTRNFVMFCAYCLQVLKAVVAKYNAEELLSKRESVSTRIRDELTHRAKQFHLIMDDVSITHLTFGHEFTKAIENKQVCVVYAMLLPSGQKMLFLCACFHPEHSMLAWAGPTFRTKVSILPSFHPYVGYRQDARTHRKLLSQAVARPTADRIQSFFRR